MLELTRCELAYGDNDQGRCAWCGDALPASRRRWCSTRCSRAYGENHYWTTARRAALDRAHYLCANETCFAFFDLEVHHLFSSVRGRKKYARGCQHHQANLIVLCHDHHAQETRLERARPGTVVQLELIAS